MHMPNDASSDAGAIGFADVWGCVLSGGARCVRRGAGNVLLHRCIVRGEALRMFCRLRLRRRALHCVRGDDGASDASADRAAALLSSRCRGVSGLGAADDSAGVRSWGREPPSCITRAGRRTRRRLGRGR